MQITLSPILHKESYTRLVEREINLYFEQVIYGPLLEIIRDAGVEPDAKDQERSNAGVRKYTTLERALAAGTIFYSAGVFTGKFNAEISREIRNAGGKWEPVRKIFTLPIEKMPFNLRSAVGRSEAAAKALNHKISATIGQMQETVPVAATGINFSNAVDKVFTDLQKQFAQSVKAVEGIEVPIQFTPELRQTLTDRLTNNSDLAIKNFASERLPVLRRKVEENAVAGYRTDRLARIIEAEFGIAKRRADFIADQETGLFVSAYREQRALNLGSLCYRWSTSHDSRVREDHRLLDKKICFWADPPIVDRATGRRRHPGQDYRCRCVPLVIINYSPFKN